MTGAAGILATHLHVVRLVRLHNSSSPVLIHSTMWNIEASDCAFAPTLMFGLREGGGGGGGAAAEGPLSGKEWRGEKNGSQRRSGMVGVFVWGKVGEWDLERRKVGGGWKGEKCGLMKREKVLIEG